MKYEKYVLNFCVIPILLFFLLIYVTEYFIKVEQRNCEALLDCLEIIQVQQLIICAICWCIVTNLKYEANMRLGRRFKSICKDEVTS